MQSEFEALKNSGDNNLYYLKSDNLINKDGEGTVDGVHLTDLGFQHIAQTLLDKINTILH